VLGLLALTSLTFSYLGAYAVAGALVQAEVLQRWQPGHDPRPRWLVAGFFLLLAAFVGIGGVARFLSRRELRHIDKMSEDAMESA
jgi:ABC-type branched-subunit amino acid transport system permease subunit